MSHFPPPTHQEWVCAIDGAQHSSWDAHYGHHITVATPGRVQAHCTCGWVCPADRTNDVHRAQLVVDDAAQHCHAIGVRCPDHQPPDSWCSECDRRERIVRDYAEYVKAQPKMWWQK